MATTPTPQSHPIRSSLPGQYGAYTDNDPTEYLLAPWEERSIAAYTHTRDFYKNHMDPATARATSLDWLAQFAGYNGVFWSSDWPEAVKRELIANAYTKVWPERGSQQLLEWLFELFELPAEIFTGTEPARANVSLADEAVVGGPSRYFHVLMPMDTERAIEWQLVFRLVALFTPLWAKYTVSYEQSRANVTRAGEVVTYP